MQTLRQHVFLKKHQGNQWSPEFIHGLNKLMNFFNRKGPFLRAFRVFDWVHIHTQYWQVSNRILTPIAYTGVANQREYLLWWSPKCIARAVFPTPSTAMGALKVGKSDICACSVIDSSCRIAPGGPLQVGPGVLCARAACMCTKGSREEFGFDARITRNARGMRWPRHSRRPVTCASRSAWPADWPKILSTPISTGCRDVPPVQA